MDFHSSSFSPPMSRNVQTDGLNVSIPEGCIAITRREAAFLPEDNPHDSVSKEVTMVSRKVQASLTLILMAVGGPANAINMAVFWKQGLRHRVNLLLFSLSLADEVSLISMTLIRFDLVNERLLGPAERVAWGMFIVNNHFYAINGSVFVSIVLSAFIALERCYCVLRPLKYHSVLSTKTMACIVVTTSIIILGLYFISILKYHNSCAFDLDTGKLSLFRDFNEVYKRHKDLVDFVGSVVFGLVIPFSVLLVVVITTTLTVWKLKRAVEWRTESSSSTTTMSPKEISLTKMLVGASLLLIVCMIPDVLFRVTRLFITDLNVRGRYNNLYVLFLDINLALETINSTFNFFVYYFMGSRYRDTFWALFRKQVEQK